MFAMSFFSLPCLHISDAVFTICTKRRPYEFPDIYNSDFSSLTFEKSMVTRRTRTLINHTLCIANLLSLSDLSGMPELEIHLLSPPHRQSLGGWARRVSRGTPHDCWLLLERLRRAGEPVKVEVYVCAVSFHTNQLQISSKISCI